MSSDDYCALFAKDRNLRNDIPHEPFGLGELRSVEEFGEKSGIDLINKKILDTKLATQALSFEEINSTASPYNEIYSEDD